jgi:hypothetical protein
VDELRARADAGDWHAAKRLADLLAAQGRVDELKARADAGDESAAYSWAQLLATQGRIGELWMEVYAGTQSAGDRLIDLLFAKGERKQAERLRSLGLEPDGSAFTPVSTLENS